jgi:hypothetical protein
VPKTAFVAAIVKLDSLVVSMADMVLSSAMVVLF